MEIQARDVGEVTILDLKGKLILDEGLATFREEINAVARRGRKVVLNLEAVPYVDSAGLGEIVRTHAALSRHDEKLKLVHVNERIQDLFSMSHLHSVLEIFESESAALKSFR